MIEPKAHTLDAPGATITYDVRSADTGGDTPALLLIGSPMGADGFATLAGFFPDRTVVTYDPRSADRSKRTDGGLVTTPEEHADDLRRVIEAVGGGPADIFASSGGAVNALVLAAKRPDLVRTLVAHEPPAAQVLPDREEALAATQTIHETYQKDGFGQAMAKFIALVMHKGPIPAGFGREPADPAAFGLPAQDDGSRDDALVGQNIVTCTHYEHDFDALRHAPTRIVVAIGEESSEEMACRATKIIAGKLGTEVAVFPSHHGGFMGAEAGPMAGKPEQFAAKLREVLNGRS
jgi:pimeloyl-ACP methyl ester carboxylesterase